MAVVSKNWLVVLGLLKLIGKTPKYVLYVPFHEYPLAKSSLVKLVGSVSGMAAQ